jgi:DNA-binding protein H-NS
MQKLETLLAQKAELRAREAELERQIAQAQREERESAISQVRSLMSQHGLTIKDIISGKAKATRGSSSKVAPKYRDSATGDTWSGRGLQPRWLKAALAEGRKLTDFAI